MDYRVRTGQKTGGSERDVEALYDEFFGTPALGPPKGKVFSEVYERAVQRLEEAERAVEAARSEFYRGDHPFDYPISESAAEAGGQDR
jgi:hypothetical protein